MKKVNVGIIGFGTVGSGVVKILQDRASLLFQRTGAQIKIKRICDQDLKKKRQVKVNKNILTRDAWKIINDPEIDVVVELIGGIHPAKEFIIAAIKNGKHIVTANKALLAAQGREIFNAAKKYGVDIYFEASAVAGVPIVKALREGFAADRISAVLGIVNGTCNFILSKMTKEGIGFREALKDAQLKGYAEKNPALDINGTDSAHKLVLLNLLSFGSFVKIKDIYVEGIVDINSNDISYADEFGYVIKLLAIAKMSHGALEVRVAPTLLSKNHLLANVCGVYNAVLVEADMAGPVLFNGKGAGSYAAASAVVSDIADVARNINSSSSRRVAEYCPQAAGLKLRKIGDIESKYYIRFSAIDSPGVLAKISGILGSHGISIASVAQRERRLTKVVPVIIMTHEAKENNLRNALKEIDRLSVIKSKSVAIRVER